MLLKVQVDALLSFLVVGWRNFPPNNFILRVMGKKDSHSWFRLLLFFFHFYFWGHCKGFVKLNCCVAWVESINYIAFLPGVSCFFLFSHIELVFEVQVQWRIFHFEVIHCSSTRHAIMKKENKTAAKVEEPTARITRARAKALGSSGGIFPSSKPSFKQDQKHVLCSKFKRAASDENKASTGAPAGIQQKRRAVLEDVTNVLCENSHINIHPTKIQVRIFHRLLCNLIR